MKPFGVITNVFRNIFSQRTTTPQQPRPTQSIFFHRPAAGIIVDEEKALTFGAVYACTRIISESIASFPWQLFEHTDLGKSKVTDHSLSRILTLQPNTEMNCMDFKVTIISHANLWGNGYAEIERDRAGNVLNLWLIHPSLVKVERNDNREIVYKIRQENMEERTIPSINMFHLKGLSPDGLTGYSVVRLSIESISLGLGVEKFAAGFFGNGAIPAFMLKVPNSMEEDDIDNFRKSWNENFRGAQKAGKTAILEQGIEPEVLGIPAKDAQMLELREFQVTEIARWFRVPPHKLADLTRSTFSNIESQNREFVTDSLLPWILRLEMEANIKLLLPSEQGVFFTKFNLNSALRADTKQRYETYGIARTHGIMSVNEIRELEDMNSIGEDGDIFLQQLNMAPAGAEATNETTEETEEPEQTNNTNELKAPFQMVFQDAAKRLVNKETIAITRAAKKYNDDQAAFSNWSFDFFAKHKRYFVDTMEVPVQSLLTAAHSADINSAATIINVYAERYTENAIQDLNTSIRQDSLEALLQDWKEEKYKEIADVLMQQTINTALVTAQATEEETNGDN